MRALNSIQTAVRCLNALSEKSTGWRCEVWVVWNHSSLLRWSHKISPRKKIKEYVCVCFGSSWIKDSVSEVCAQGFGCSLLQYVTVKDVRALMRCRDNTQHEQKTLTHETHVKVLGSDDTLAILLAPLKEPLAPLFGWVSLSCLWYYPAIMSLREHPRSSYILVSCLCPAWVHRQHTLTKSGFLCILTYPKHKSPWYGPTHTQHTRTFQ